MDNSLSLSCGNLDGDGSSGFCNLTTFSLGFDLFGFETAFFLVGCDLLLDALLCGDVGEFFSAFGGRGFDLFLLFEVFFDVLDFAGGFLADFLRRGFG